MKTKLSIITILILTFSAVAQTNYLNPYPSLMVTNFTPEMEVIPKWDYSNGNTCISNVVISQNYKGTFQIGTNFFTLKEFQRHWKEMGEFQLDIAEAKGRLQAYRDVALNQTRITSSDTNIVEWEWDSIRKHNEEAAKQEAFVSAFNATNTNPRMTAVWTKWRWSLPQGERERGYRSDGVMVWRHQ